VTDTAAVQRLFDEVAAEYDQHLPFFATFGRDLVDWSGLQPGQRVLDIAAGRGAITVPAAQAVGKHGAVVAVDNAPNMLSALATEFRARLFAGLDAMQASGGITVSNGAAFTRARKPSSD
jgi:ubiquinone/menaquinone biosynthesis C-methylase UbiE